MDPHLKVRVNKKGPHRTLISSETMLMLSLYLANVNKINRGGLFDYPVVKCIGFGVGRISGAGTKFNGKGGG
jgi:hypothetical protein